MAFATDAQRRWFFAHLATGMRRIGRKMRKAETGTEPVQATQYMTDFPNEADARQALKTMRMQQGMYGGRVLAPSVKSKKWQLQMFGEPGGEFQEGARKVLIPRGQFKALKIRPSRLGR